MSEQRTGLLAESFLNVIAAEAVVANSLDDAAQSDLIDKYITHVGAGS